ncbi:MAG: HlyC/CorC family transporter [Lentisphaerae bacterium]|nr:MAG: HlyC/CorC family transporter [Lentisphaerota bacterium]
MIALSFIILCFLIVLLASAFFSASETSFFSLPPATVTRWRNSGSPTERLAASLLGNEEQTLVTILLGNNFVNLFAPLLMVRILTFHPFVMKEIVRFAGILGITPQVLLDVLTGTITTTIILIGGEVLPKTIAFSHAAFLAPRFAYVVKALQTLSTPIVISLEWCSKKILDMLGSREACNALNAEEYLAFLDIAKEMGALVDNEIRLIERIMELRQTRVSEIMVPRTDIDALDISLPADHFVDLLRQYHHNHVPVICKEIDQIKGILKTKPYLQAVFFRQHPPHELEPFLSPPCFIPEHTTVIKAFENMLGSHSPLAVVINEFGGVEGLLSPEDVIEEVVGEIVDEFDVPECQITQISPHRFRVLGHHAISQICEELGCPLEHTESQTIGGFIAERLGRIPRTGDRVEEDGWGYCVRQAKRHRVLEVEIEKMSLDHPAEQEQEDAGGS